MYASDWQTSNLDVTDGVAGGPYEALVAERLDGFRRLAATRPGSASVAAALADIVDLAQPLPMRWPVGYEATRDIADPRQPLRRGVGRAAAQRRARPVAPPAPPRPATAGRARLVDRQRRAGHRARSRGFGAEAAGELARRGNTVVATMRTPDRDRAGGRRRLRGPHPPGRLDVTIPAEVTAVVAEAVARHGRIDAL